MNNAIIFIKTEPKVKEEAQKTAAELGFSLSSVLNAFLRQFVKTKTVHFSVRSETPNAYFKQAIKEAKEDLQHGRTSPVFNSADEMIAWLNKHGV